MCDENNTVTALLMTALSGEFQQMTHGMEMFLLLLWNRKSGWEVQGS